MSTAGWSARFAPTPTRSTRTGAPTERRCSTGPIPERIRIEGLPNVPAHRTTQPASITVPSARRTPHARSSSRTTSETSAVGTDGQIGRRRTDRQVGVSSRDPGAVPRVHRHPAGTDRAGAVVVLDNREAGCLERIEAGPGHIGVWKVEVTRRRHRAASSVPGAIAELRIGLEPEKVREDVVKAPAGVSARRPGVVIGGGAAWRESRHPGSSTEELAPAHVFDAAARVGFRCVAPLEPPCDLPAVADVVRWVGSAIRTRFE